MSNEQVSWIIHRREEFADGQPDWCSWHQLNCNKRNTKSLAWHILESTEIEMEVE